MPSDELAILLDLHRPQLHKLLQQRTGAWLLKRMDVEDLVQEACMEATRCIGSYRPQGHDSFFRWLATVALNRMQNLRRLEAAQKRDAGRPLPFVGQETMRWHPGVQDAVAAEPGPSTLLIGAEQQTTLLTALQRLSPTDQEVIRLSRDEQLSLAEVAMQMGRTRNAVALLLSRALRKLRAEVERG